MRFDFDSGKSRTNKHKHGIDFVKAQALWDDPDLVEIPAHTSDEPRSIVIGKIGSRQTCCRMFVDSYSPLADRSLLAAYRLLPPSVGKEILGLISLRNFASSGHIDAFR